MVDIRVLVKKTDRFDCVPWCHPEGDKTFVHIATREEGENKSKRKVGTIYSLIKPLEKAAAQKASALTLTSFGKIEATRSGWQAWIRL